MTTQAELDMIDALDDCARELERVIDRAFAAADVEFYGRANLRETAMLLEWQQRKAWTLHAHYELEAINEALA